MDETYYDEEYRINNNYYNSEYYILESLYDEIHDELKEITDCNFRILNNDNFGKFLMLMSKNPEKVFNS
jgi:hypothetical protein